jgi:hypothetical protein
LYNFERPSVTIRQSSSIPDDTPGCIAKNAT